MSDDDVYGYYDDDRSVEVDRSAEIITPTCVLLKCQIKLACHRCGRADETVDRRFIADPTVPCIPGAQLKVTGHWSHCCLDCLQEWNARIRST